jgi:short-subunit dehydrogenase
MKVQLKEVGSQVMVITGATSGIGLATAREASRRGARLVLAARNEAALGTLQQELRATGKQVICVTADVSNEQDVRRVHDEAMREFGGFDTWVNNAAVALYGRLEDVSLDDLRTLFEINFWGVVYGCRIALPHLRQGGGALINMGSVVSDRAMPLQGMYSASKHAVKGFTDALRMELEAEAAPVSVTLIKPGSIDTPWPIHAKNYMHEEPTLAPPVYAPDLVANAILHAAEKPVRDIFVGGGAKALSVAGMRWPRLMDMLMERTMFSAQKAKHPKSRPPGHNLDRPAVDLRARGDYDGHVARSSLYTAAMLEPLRNMPRKLAAGIASAFQERQARRHAAQH